MRVIVIILSVFLTSCVSRGRDTLTIGLLNKPLSLESWKIRDGASTVIGNQIHRGLIRIDPETGNYISAVAESWQFSKEGKTVRFQVRNDLKFHDGTKVDCIAVKKSFDRLLVNHNDTTVIFPSRAKFFCENERTFVIEMPFVPAQLMDLIASPAASVSKEQNGRVGVGPYRLTSESENEIVLERVAAEGPHFLKFRIGDYQELIRSFEAGQMDDLMYLGFFTDISLKQCQKIVGISPTSFWFGVNSRKWGFSDKSVRKTILNHLRMSIEQTNPFKEELQSESIIPFGVSGHRKPGSLNSDKIDQSRELIKRLVNKHGKIEFALRSIQQDSYDWQNLLAKADPLHEIFEVKFLENNSFFKRYYSNDLTLYFIGANVTRNDPFEVLSYFRSGDFVNRSNVTRQKVDHLMEEAAMALSAEKVRELAQTADRWIVEEGYALPLFSKRFSGCVRSGLKGYKLSPLGPLSIDYSQIELSD